MIRLVPPMVCTDAEIDEGNVFHGPAAVVAYFQDVAATFGEWQIEAEEVLRNGEKFVVFWRETTRTHELEMQAQTAMLFVVRDGKIVEARGYLDRTTALEAAGLA